MLTLEQAKNLRRGEVVTHAVFQNADGTPARFRVNGVPTAWKRRPDRVYVPLKRGLYEYSAITEDNLQDFSIVENW